MNGMPQSWEDQSWDIPRNFLTYIGFLIGTSMVLAGSIFTSLPSLYVKTGTKTGEPINLELTMFYQDVLASLAVTIATGAVAALLLFVIRTVCPKRTIKEWKELKTYPWTDVLWWCVFIVTVPTIFGGITAYNVLEGFVR